MLTKGGTMAIEFESLTMMDFRRSPGSILDRVSREGTAFIIERSGRQMACLVPVSLFLPDIKQSRLNEEMDELHQKGEHPLMAISDAKEVVIQFQEILGDKTITIKVLLPHGYPNAPPKVYASPIVHDAPHRWQDGSLCIVGATVDWNPGKHTIAFLLTWVRKWLSNYDHWRRTGQWPVPESEDV